MDTPAPRPTPVRWVPSPGWAVRALSPAVLPLRPRVRGRQCVAYDEGAGGGRAAGVGVL